MLTRLKVHGFKNLIDVDTLFGPFTCVAGVNGVGKSNLFDAITFLSALADRPLMDAARGIRDELNRTTEVRSLFTRGKNPLGTMSFTAEMIVPPQGIDDLGQQAIASITFLRYHLKLGLLEPDAQHFGERLRVVHEELTHINLGDATDNLAFKPSPRWHKSAILGARRGGPFISTKDDGGNRLIRLHQDKTQGRPREFLADSLPRTVVSSANASESPTVLLAKREMQSWRLLQMEPSALRCPDKFNSPVHISPNGSHVAATLHALARMANEGKDARSSASVTQSVANRLSELVEDITEVRIDEDSKRELLTLEVVDRAGSVHAARALSDGTLRFLALSILELDPEARGLLCFEEPENGIHPQRIEAMLRLLKDLAVDTEDEVGLDNPLRQVIVNTHSPQVVALVNDEDLLVAQPQDQVVDGHHYPAVTFAWLSDTWRDSESHQTRPLSRGELSAYLNPFAFDDKSEEANGSKTADDSTDQNGRRRGRRVKDREDLQTLFAFAASEQ